MIGTTYTCDRCNHEQTTFGKMWTVEIAVNEMGTWSKPSNSKGALSKLWCRRCVETFGLLQPAKDDTEHVITPPPTLEDLIREIVQNEMEAGR